MIGGSRSRSCFLLAGLLGSFTASRPAVAQLQPMSVSKLADGVYGAIYSEMKRDPVQSNSLIIIGDDGVCVVDAHYTPSAARATIAEIRKLTRLPVRYVVTTHWHDDHIFGNSERPTRPGRAQAPPWCLAGTFPGKARRTSCCGAHCTISSMWTWLDSRQAGAEPQCGLPPPDWRTRSLIPTHSYSS